MLLKKNFIRKAKIIIILLLLWVMSMSRVFGVVRITKENESANSSPEHSDIRWYSRFAPSFCQLLQHGDSLVSHLKKKRIIAVISAQGLIYGGSLLWLNQQWYSNYQKQSFHLFDDSREWLQMDKAGHLVTAYYLSRIGIDLMQWSGVRKNKSLWMGSAGSFLYLTGIEISDGFSSGWGFSLGDFSANAIGTGISIGQKFLLQKTNQPRVLGVIRGFANASFRFSFHPSPYPAYRPSLLGKNRSEQWLKDYNGQTYWLSFNISSFLKEEKNNFPRWLNVAAGYGAEGMIGGKENPPTDEAGNPVSFQRYRKFYLALDIDFTRIKTNSSFLKTIFETLSVVKIPTPAIEISRKEIKGHGLFPMF